MRYIPLLPLLLLTMASLQAQDVRYLVAEGGQLEKAMKDDEALVKYEEALRLNPDDLRALTAAAALRCAMGNRTADKSIRETMFRAAKTNADRALRMDSTDADANYAMALSLAMLSQTVGKREQAGIVKEMKRYADAALVANPDHVKALHLLGKWHYEVARLNPVEKAALKVLFGGLPPASLDEAIRLMEKARTLSPGFVGNYLALALAYRDNYRSDKAIEVLTRMVKLPPKTADDPGLKAEGRKLLESLM